MCIQPASTAIYPLIPLYQFRPHILFSSILHHKHTFFLRSYNPDNRSKSRFRLLHCSSVTSRSVLQDWHHRSFKQQYHPCALVNLEKKKRPRRLCNTTLRTALPFHPRDILPRCEYNRASPHRCSSPPPS
jgi:hypothetical protein